MAPAALRLSKSTGRSARVSGMQPPEGPPICTALRCRPPSMPPPISSTMRRMLIPMGTSISPPRTILPARAKVLVPGLVGVPAALKASTPWVRIQGTVARVSTLLTRVGCPHRPLVDG